MPINYKSKLSEWTCLAWNTPNKSKRTFCWSKIYWRTNSYAVHFFYVFHFCQNDFPVPINCLNCQSELVMPKIYQTEAKKPLIYSNYTGVRACTPCTFAPKNGVRARTPIHFSFISNFSKLIFWVWKHLKVLYWHVFIQYMLHRSIWTFISNHTTRRTSSYAVHFWPVQFWPASPLPI